jgi:hypothetical protein
VSDNGIGMSLEERQRLEALLRSGHIDNRISRNSSGFGTGLLISNLLCRTVLGGKFMNSGLKFETLGQNKGCNFSFYVDSWPQDTEIEYNKDISLYPLSQNDVSVMDQFVTIE